MKSNIDSLNVLDDDLKELLVIGNKISDNKIEYEKIKSIFTRNFENQSIILKYDVVKLFSFMEKQNVLLSEVACSIEFFLRIMNEKSKEMIIKNNIQIEISSLKNQLYERDILIEFLRSKLKNFSLENNISHESSKIIDNSTNNTCEDSTIQRNCNYRIVNNFYYNHSDDKDKNLANYQEINSKNFTFNKDILSENKLNEIFSELDDSIKIEFNNSIANNELLKECKDQKEIMKNNNDFEELNHSKFIQDELSLRKIPTNEVNYEKKLSNINIGNQNLLKRNSSIGNFKEDSLKNSSNIFNNINNQRIKKKDEFKEVHSSKNVPHSKMKEFDCYLKTEQSQIKSKKKLQLGYQNVKKSKGLNEKSFEKKNFLTIDTKNSPMKITSTKLLTHQKSEPDLKRIPSNILKNVENKKYISNFKNKSLHISEIRNTLVRENKTKFENIFNLKQNSIIKKKTNLNDRYNFESLNYINNRISKQSINDKYKEKTASTTSKINFNENRVKIINENSLNKIDSAYKNIPSENKTSKFSSDLDKYIRQTNNIDIIQKSTSLLNSEYHINDNSYSGDPNMKNLQPIDNQELCTIFSDEKEFFIDSSNFNETNKEKVVNLDQLEDEIKEEEDYEKTKENMSYLQNNYRYTQTVFNLWHKNTFRDKKTIGLRSELKKIREESEEEPEEEHEEEVDESFQYLNTC